MEKMGKINKVGYNTNRILSNRDYQRSQNMIKEIAWNLDVQLIRSIEKQLKNRISSSINISHKKCYALNVKIL